MDYKKERQIFANTLKVQLELVALNMPWNFSGRKRMTLKGSQK